MKDKKEAEDLKNTGNAALFNLTAASMRKAGDQEWAYAVRALQLAVQLARSQPKDSVGITVLRALQTAKPETSSLLELEEELAKKKEKGRVMIFPALMLAARYAHEMPKASAEEIVRLAIRDAGVQLGIAE